MNDRAVRIATLIGLMPLAVFVWAIAVCCLAPLHLDSTRVVPISIQAATAVVFIVVMGVWRRHIRWSRAKHIATSLLTLTVLIHGGAWQAIYNFSGCASDVERNLLCLGQQLVLVGFWAGGCTLLWWRFSPARRSITSRIQTTNSGGLSMSKQTIRLAIGLALIPLLVGAFFVLYFTFERKFSLVVDESIFAAYEFCTVIAIVVWLIAWAGLVKWTRRSSLIVASLAVLFLASPAAILLPKASGPYDLFQLFLPLFALAAWFIGTAWTWRTADWQTSDGDKESLQRVIHCPTCNYSLVGLREVRCPECGWTSTIDDVVHRSLQAISFETE